MMRYRYSVFSLLAFAISTSSGANNHGKTSHLRRSGSGGQQQQQQRRLQDDDADLHPCQLPPEEAFLPQALKPSYLENCAEALPVNTTLMIFHVELLRQQYQEYYCFYNIVNDPQDSDPSGHQPELGYTIFSGPEEGQVRLDDELIALQETIQQQANGASAANFWDITVPFNSLYDAHVTVPSTAFPASYFFMIWPESNLNGEKGGASFVPKYNKGGEMDLSISFDGPDGSESHNIKSMMGMTPYDFFMSLVMNPALGNWLSYQSPGARMNALVKAQSIFGSPMVFPASVRPSLILPETFVVEYDDGQQETYYTGIFFNEGTEYVYGNLTLLPSFDSPGAAWQAFETAIEIFDNATSIQLDDMDAEERNKIPEDPKRSRGMMNGDSYEFDQLLSAGGLVRAAIKVEEDYAILKIEDFDFFLGDDGGIAAISFWANFTAAAKAAGVKKAIIDVAGNGGGIAISGTMMAFSMYPFTPYEVFQLEYDANYNDVMQIYNLTIAPLIESLDEVLQNSTDTELQEYLDILPPGVFEQLVTSVYGLITLCCQGIDLETCPSTKAGEQCAPLYGMVSPLQKIDEFPTGPQLRNLLREIVSLFATYNPFNILGFQEQIDRNTIIDSVRGGIKQSTTNKYAFLSPDLYFPTGLFAFQNDWEFDEYAIVSDGAAGSTTCIFSATATQIWANRDASGAKTPLTTVTYGGTKIPSDTTVTGFPASVQNVKIDFPLITSGLLEMTNFLFPDNETTTLLDEINAIYSSVLPLPPYFAEALPRMPVNNFYSAFMEPGALPLQYVKIVGDKHIPQLYTRTTIADGADLPSIYKQTAKLSFTTKLPPIPETSSDEGLPIPEASSDEGLPIAPENSEDGSYGGPHEGSP